MADSRRVAWAEIRRSLGLSIRQMAARLGISKTALYQLERVPGRRAHALTLAALDGLLRERDDPATIEPGAAEIVARRCGCGAPLSGHRRCWRCGERVGPGHGEIVGYVCRECDERRRRRRKERGR